MAIAFIEAVSDNNTGTTNQSNIVFTGTPADGEALILAGLNRSGGHTFPAGFNELGLSGLFRMAWKEASSESGATYDIDYPSENENMAFGFRFSKDAAKIWVHLAGAGASDTSGSDNFVTTAEATSAVNNFFAVGAAVQFSAAGSFSGSGSFGGTATGGTNINAIDDDPSSSSLDVKGTSDYRIFTGSGTVDWTSKSFGNSSRMDARVELFEEQDAIGGENPNPSASTQRDVQTIANRAFDPANNILNVTTF